MLLVITLYADNAADLGYLLHKNPRRPQALQMNFGKAYVFYPAVRERECSAALLLDVNPLDLARGKLGSREGGLFDYVNDRPYVCSSFMSTAISRVYGTAMAGRCEKRQALADSALDFGAELAMLPCRGDTAMLERVFSPLGYSVEFSSGVLDGKFPEWGQSRYVNLRLRARLRLRDLLRHLYVLIPVFDRQKHYWFGADEIDKLLRHGEGWLEAHPEKEFITRRYFSRQQSYVRAALDRMDDGEGGAQDDAVPAAEESEKAPNLNTRRLEAVMAALRESGAASVMDLGCGAGNLLRLLVKEKTFTRIAGTDVSPAALRYAAERLNLERLGGDRISLFQSSLTYRDKRFSGYDAAAVVEVMEHLDESRLVAFAAVLFGEARPATIVLTTPNREYNANYPNLSANGLRHSDHRFEWTRGRFRAWAGQTAQSYGYTVRYEDIGEKDAERGGPTQMGVFTRC
jgi:3' terminal RNA ribose 2'-O-methyltransferase Hen1